MARRTLNRHELRAAAEAAEKLGLNTPEPRRPRGEPADRKPKPPEAKGRLKVVWAVCDLFNRTVATFPYADKAAAEALAADLKSKGKGNHFVRSVKEPL
ncbi:MAG TPA: hypothetical protein VG406_24650 [Isosphaeraceae bacterium]|jgi:hypothetical protein|nr:hypothetical protein [Isosphaeraceae bacterium]